MKLLEILFYLFLITLSLGTRVIVYQFTAGFHEYETVSIYASDLFLIIFLLFSVKSYFLSARSESKDYISVSLRLRSGNINKSLIVVFLFFSFLSIFFAPATGLAIYDFARLLLLAIFAVAVGKLLSDKKVFARTLAIIAVLAVIQSGIGFSQFKNQGALGLKVLGESPISVFDGGTSKIIVGGSKVVRAYGTFPHPNTLAAFLILGLFSLFYFFLRQRVILNPPEADEGSLSRLKDPSALPQDDNCVVRFFSRQGGIRMTRMALACGIFIVLLGLALTFSRAAWLIAVILSLFTFLFALSSKTHRLQALKLLFTLVTGSLLLVIILYPFILPRASLSLEEPAVTQRLAYNDLALYLIKNKPLGVGIGNQVLYSVENGVYQKFGMDKVWQWQPIHNLYLLMASEIGIIGLLAFLAFIISLPPISKSKFLISNQIPKPNGQNSKNSSLITSYLLLVTLLLFGFFDHFLWTIQQGRLMLWLVIGMALALTHCNTSYYNGKHEEHN